MLKKLKNFLNSRARRKAAEQMPRDEDGKFVKAPASVAPSATKAPAKKAPAKKAPAKKAAPAPKKK